jgi:transcriptional regulator with XRE-family HTH domain
LLLIVSSWKSCTFAGNRQDVKMEFMMFTERIKQLREERQIPQRKLAAALDIDTATYCKYEKGGRRPRREQVVILADLLETDKEELLTLWLADQIKNLISHDSDKIVAGAIKLVYNQNNIYDDSSNR